MQTCNFECRLKKASIENVQLDLCFCDFLTDGESIDTVTWRTSSGVEIVKLLLPIEGCTVSAIVGGGQAGNTYTVCAHIETSTGQHKQLCALVAVSECPPDGL